MSASGSTAKAGVNDRAAGVYSYAQRSLDRVVAPSSRRRAYDSASALASSRPILFVRPLPPPRAEPTRAAPLAARLQASF